MVAPQIFSEMLDGSSVRLRAALTSPRESWPRPWRALTASPGLQGMARYPAMRKP